MHRKQLIALLVAFVVLPSTNLRAQARLQDITEIDGVRDNSLIGLGLVSGLTGTGDTGQAARSMISNMLRRMNVNISPEQVKPGNVAVVTVSARLGPFKRPGDKLDVTVSSFGDAQSLFGGQLLLTQLTGPDMRTVLAVAEGPVMNGAPGAQGASGSKEQINHPTVGRVPNGAVVEKEVPQKILTEEGNIRLRLRESSFATARNLAESINKLFPRSARALDGITIVVNPPAAYKTDPVPFLAQIGDIRILIDVRAKVVLSERNGTIVAGDNVTLLPCAISQGNLSISVKEDPQVSQPNSFNDSGKTTVTPKSDVKISEKGIEMRAIPGTVTAGELARALNSLGVSPRDLITIFQMLKANGALQAELDVQ